jgi:hypothetical protein
MLVPLARVSKCREALVREGIAEELVCGAMHVGAAGSREAARALIVTLAHDSHVLTESMLALVRDKVSMCLKYPMSMDLLHAVEGEMTLLGDMCTVMDTCWEIKYKALMQVQTHALLMTCPAYDHDD